MSVRVGIFFTHPIQYFAPLFRKLAAMPELEILVHYFSDASVRGGVDRGFGVSVKWDVPLLDGYPHVFVSRDADVANVASVRLDDPHRTLTEGKFDVVFFQGYARAFERQLLKACWKQKVPVVLRGDFSDRPPVADDGRGRPLYRRILRDFFLKRFYAKVSRFCVVGSDARSHLVRLGVSAERMVWSPYAIDDDLLIAQAREFQRDVCRSELGIAADKVVVLFSGKFVARKNPLLLIDAIARLDFPENVHLLMLGDGPLRGAIEQRCATRIAGRFTLPGFVNQSQLGRYFRAADLFVLPSDFETWGLVVNEAMRFELPVICSDNVGSADDLIEPNRTGWTFPVGSVESLTNTLNQAVLRGVAGLQAMKPAVNERIDQYTLDRTAAGIRDAILQAAATRRA